MKLTAIDAVRALVSAYEGRSVYGASHTRTMEQVRKCVAAVEQSSTEAGAVAIVMMSGGLVVNKRTVSEPWAQGALLLGKLAANGIHAIRISRGATEQDILWLMDAAMTGGVTASPSGRVVLGKLKSGTLSAGSVMEWGSGQSAGAEGEGKVNAGAAQQEPQPPNVQQETVHLRDVWTCVLAGNEEDGGTLAGLAMRLMSAVIPNRSSLIYLADLKGHDEYTFVHVTNVALLASALGQAVGLSGDDLRGLTEGALLHDIGKWSVPKRILVKPGRLTEDERREMETHPLIGARILASSKGISDVAVVAAMEHHMRLDGNGYPHTTRGRRPALVSQIVQVADIFDALRSNRPYRPGLSLDRCVELMEMQSGSSFETELFNVFKERVLNRLLIGDVKQAEKDLRDAA
ncbi:MAG TPA: HD domain-containing phosphohydrolase [Phycisphaerales bacterium]|nr:HD domain-containing phosphohydrolase [Phycisphaerales bacterium]